ncbi:MAG: hypothetical protein ILO42_05680 [Clostridia bacterium]|nr:hypothetical protein [Clostridia bacterium]
MKSVHSVGMAHLQKTPKNGENGRKSAILAKNKILKKAQKSSKSQISNDFSNEPQKSLEVLLS